MNEERCGDFKVFPREAFYAIPQLHWNDFFEPKRLNATMQMVKDSMVVKFWDRFSRFSVLERDKKTALTQLAAMHCPFVYRSSLDAF